jgi:4-hydroxy-4-methyl-2-oxoglutarate aldolase
LGFPVFARGLSVKGTTKERSATVGLPILCGGVAVAPGDAVIGDDDGVVVVPRAMLATTLRAAHERDAKERALLERIRAGESTMDLLNLRGRLTS